MGLCHIQYMQNHQIFLIWYTLIWWTGQRVIASLFKPWIQTHEVLQLFEGISRSQHHLMVNVFLCSSPPQHTLLTADARTHTQQHSLMHIANFSLAHMFFIIFSFIYISLFQVISRHFIIIIDFSPSVNQLGHFLHFLFSIIQCSWLFPLACACEHWRSFERLFSLSFQFVFYCHSPTQAPLVLCSLLWWIAKK